MNITEHRKQYFHLDSIDSTKKDKVEGQETVEEWLFRKDKKGCNHAITIIPMGTSRFKNDLEKGNDARNRRKAGK